MTPNTAEYEPCPQCDGQSLAEAVDLPDMAHDEHYRFCPRCLANEALANKDHHSHGKNVGHSHPRGNEDHHHIGRKANDGSIVWMTLWPDGSEEVHTLGEA